MTNGITPSTSAGASAPAALDAARGTLREALSALRNFAELLHSVRVGSKALSALLPDVAAGTTPMGAAVDRLLEAFATHPDLGDASASLRAYLTPRLAALQRELESATERPLSTRSRLSLEQIVTRLSLELDTARGLLDLLSESASDRSLHLDLVELVQQSFAGPPSGGSWNRTQIRATLSCTSGEAEVESNPRVVTALFALGVELVAERAPGAPHIVVVEDGCGGYRVNIGRRGAAIGEDLILIARGVIEPTLTCLRAASRASGIEFGWDETARSLDLKLGPARPRAQLSG